MSAKDCISYHDGIFIPPLIVTGDIGALGSSHLTPGSKFCPVAISGKNDQPAPESPNPWANMMDAVCFALAGIVTTDMLDWW